MEINSQLDYRLSVLETDELRDLTIKLLKILNYSDKIKPYQLITLTPKIFYNSSIHSLYLKSNQENKLIYNADLIRLPIKEIFRGLAGFYHYLQEVNAIVRKIMSNSEIISVEVIPKITNYIPKLIYSNATENEKSIIEAITQKLTLDPKIFAAATVQEDHIENLISESKEFTPQKTLQLIPEPPRSSDIKEYAIHRANGKCEYCSCLLKPDDHEGLLCEIHHIDGVQNSDEIYSVTCLCPLCHARVTRGINKKRINIQIRTLIWQLEFENLPEEIQKMLK